MPGKVSGRVDECCGRNDGDIVLRNGNTNAVRLSVSTRGHEIASVIDRLPAHLQPKKGSFADTFSRACAEIALSAELDENGVATVQPSALLHLARLLCGRSLKSGDCHDACRLQHQCVGSTKLVMASFGTQASACLEALGLRVASDRMSSHQRIGRQPAQPTLLDLRKVDSAA